MFVKNILNMSKGINYTVTAPLPPGSKEKFQANLAKYGSKTKGKRLLASDVLRALVEKLNGDADETIKFLGL